MKAPWIAAAISAIIALPAAAQAPMTTATLLNRMASAYRSMQSYQDTGTLARKIGPGKEATATFTIAAVRPGKYLLDVKGDKSENINTAVVSNGDTLYAIRPQRKAYVKSRAPERLMGADMLAKVDVPAPGARIVTMLLENGLRTSTDPLAGALGNAEIEAPKPFGDKLAYTLTVRYDQDRDAKVYVTDGDYLVRRVTLVREGKVELTEDHSTVDVDKPVADATFAYKLPDNAQLVYTLPPIPAEQVVSSGPTAPDFTVETVGGGKLHLSDYRGKVVVLDFWATWCGPCQRSMPHIERVAQQVKDQGVVVLGVCSWDDASAFTDWLPAHRTAYSDFTFAFDLAAKDTPNSIAMRRFGVDGIPTTFVIDKEGEIIGKVVGYSGEDDTRLESVLRKLGLNVG